MRNKTLYKNLKSYYIGFSNLDVLFEKRDEMKRKGGRVSKGRNVKKR